ncbi:MULTISPECIES: SDR family oxidoreductase [unclassified Aminobacter]|uniref:SDR family oxidoreductase n=1 Tax=unclassified Aminobacter TaxID=2644704 RepID=UPI00046549A6|nr:MULTISPECIES: SDR family oxidoreductase [unclassified Aminobacter]TWG61020.1 nucleoside-diphosphate-sugar epimerase [Aminobacter sp. J44]TWH27213.1 nucleoside-diphosphate-sugar epimerase [Aminobacter sp. J15]
MSGKLFIFGVGYSGLEIAREALARGWSVAGTTRSADKAEKLRAQGIEPHLLDGGQLSNELAAALRETTHLVVSIAPGEADPVLRVARETILLKMPKLRWIGYLSTVGVYGDHGGAWVDEETECRPVSKRSIERLNAERQWQALGEEASVPVAVLRLAGIYGPGRNAFANLANGTARRIVKPGQVFNRIHVADIAATTVHLAEGNIGGVFNVSDDEACPPQDVVAYAAKLMGVEAPPEIPFDEAEMTSMARSFYGENKRVSNARLKAQGLVLKFPNYRAALDALWQDGNWRGDAS